MFRAISRRLKTRLMVYVIIALTPLIILNLISENQARNALRDAVIANSFEVAASTISATTNLLENMQSLLDAAALALATGHIPPDDANSYLADVMSDSQLATLLALNNQGIVVSSDSPVRVGTNRSSRQWFQAIAVDRNRRYLSDVFITGPARAITEPSGRKVVVMSTGTWENGTLQLVLATAIRPATLSQLVTATGAEGQHVAILDSRGNVIATGFKELMEEPGIVNRSYVPGVGGALQGRRSTFSDWRDPVDGVIKMGVAVPMPNTSWVVIVMQPQQAALAPVMTEARRDMLVLFAFAAVSLLLAWYFGNHITDPLYHLSQDASKVAAGNLDTRSDIQREDEIGHLARSFNEMANNLQAFSRVSQAATSKLKMQELLDSIAYEVHEATGYDLCLIGILDETREEVRIAAANGLQSSIWVDTGIPVGEKVCGQAVAEGRPITIHGMESEDRICVALTEAEEACAAAAIPINLGDKTIGVLCVYAKGDEPIPESDIGLLTTMAAFAAIGIQNSRAYERERHIAETLQRSFLPDIPPSIGNFELAHLYRPALEEAEIGGDFYDFFRTGANQYGLVIGDVAGKGVEAAVTAAMGKYMMRAFAWEDPNPEAVLNRLNNALLVNVIPGNFVTIIYGVLDLDTSVLTFVNAGHELPLLHKSKSGMLNTVDVKGTAAGILPDAKYNAGQIAFEPEDSLLLYTDGATDARRGRDFFDVSGLAAAMLKYCDRWSAQECIEGVFQTIMEFSGGKIRDDIAMMAIRLRSDEAEPAE
jgi:phosphoserine phosphatase RsbU/P